MTKAHQTQQNWALIVPIRKTKQEGKKSRLSKELAELKKEMGSREQKRAAAHGKLVRPTRASEAPG